MRKTEMPPTILTIFWAVILGLMLCPADKTFAQAPAVSPAAATTLPTTEVPFYHEWAGSPHANKSAEPFNHWNSDGKIPVECARCHSTPGFQDYLGADGSAAGVVDKPAPIGTVITCIACHNAKTLHLTSVTFPSGLRVNNLGASAICMTCHQGVESTASVTKAIEGTPDDTVNAKLAFLNVHYRAAGATIMGTRAKVAYEYPGKTYAGEIQHAAPFTNCLACHDQHTTELKASECGTCHAGVSDVAAVRRIRMRPVDFDGSGDLKKGMSQEVGAMREKLAAAITLYAKNVANKPIVYKEDIFPYFFNDTNGNGVADPDETKFPNRYNAWTPRLLKAAFNYQFVTKDPGSYAHNPVYTLQILYDSLADLGTKVNANLGNAKRP
jgi:Cytochrome c7 and related cytochrome c